jgi:tRNA threonylcarbamoyladenosine biosynthesis protein TsaE
MGAGKTTFVHAVCNLLGVKGAVSSPTFSIINEYTSAEGKTIYHLDLYRLKNVQEAIGAGVEDCLYSGNLCLVEWPEITPSLFLDDTVHCYLTVTGDNERKLVIG